MELNFDLYPRGFIFSTQELIEVPSNYNHIVINDKYYYSYCEQIKKMIYENEDKFVIIHGNATYVHHQNVIPHEELPSYLGDLYFENYDEFLNTLDYIGGRYAVIIGNKDKVMVYQDATGGRSLYYSLDYNVISSHAHLINDNIMHSIDEKVQAVKKLGINWNLSPYTNIKALTPNICFELYSKKTERFFPRESNKFTHLSKEERLSLAEKLWKKQYEFFFKTFSKLAFSITGGLDSRVSLAMLREKIPEINFFTYMTEIPNPKNEKNTRLLKNDGIRVKELLKDIELNHQFIKIENSEKKLSDKDQNNLSKNTIGSHNFGLLRSYKKLFPEKNVLHIRSNLNEIGRANLMEKNVGNNLQRVQKYFINSFRKANEEELKNENIDLESIAQKGVNDFKYENDRFDFHIMDLYYWENRSGRWISEILNETDVCFETFSGYNLRAIIEISLSFTFDERKSSVFFKELINRNYPILNFYGVNSDENLFEAYMKLLDSEKSEKESKSIVSYAQKSSEKIYDKINNLKKHTDNQTFEYLNQLNHILMLNKENIKFMQECISVKNNDHNVIFSDFKLYDQGNEQEVYTEQLNTLFIPSQMLKRKNFVEVSFKFQSKKGYLELSLINRYINENARDYIKYILLKNNTEILEEDISKWNFENNITIFNLNKSDVITVRLLVLKDCQSESWSNASRLTIKNIKEVEINREISDKVKITSPDTQLLLN